MDTKLRDAIQRFSDVQKRQQKALEDFRNSLELLKSSLKRLDFVSTSVLKKNDDKNIEDPHKPPGRPPDVVDGQTKTWNLPDGGQVVADEYSVIWVKNNQLHRADGPAVTYANGSQEWWQNGRLHRLE